MMRLLKRLMMIFFIVCVTTAHALLFVPTAAAQERNPPVIVPADTRHIGDLSTITQDIEVYGAVTGDVTSWSGAIVITGHVGGDVVSYAGTVQILEQGRVDGHVLSVDGELNNQGAIAGQMFTGLNNDGALASVFDLFAPPGAQTSASTELGRILFGALVGVFIVAFGILWIAIWPQRTMAAAITLRNSPGRSIALGLLSTLMVALLLPPLIALLTATLIGMPFIALLLVIAHIPYLYGFAASAHTLGHWQKATLSLGSHSFSRSTSIVMTGFAGLIGIVATQAPLVGLALFYTLAAPGLGAVIISRGGLQVPQPLWEQ
jgi:cytoskeletal protein CcmA (bactofilin family)